MARYPTVVANHALVPDWWPWMKAEYEMSPEAIVVFLFLCTHAAPDRLVVLPSRTIAADTGISRTTVVRAIDALIECGAVVDLGRDSKRSPQKLRIALSKPLPRQRLDLPSIADPALRARMRRAR